MIVRDLLKLLSDMPQEADVVLLSSEVSATDLSNVRFVAAHSARGSLTGTMMDIPDSVELS